MLLVSIATASLAQPGAALSGSGASIFILSREGYFTNQQALSISIDDDRSVYSTDSCAYAVSHHLQKYWAQIGYDQDRWGAVSVKDINLTSSALQDLHTKDMQQKADSLINTTSRLSRFNINVSSEYGLVINSSGSAGKQPWAGLENSSVAGYYGAKELDGPAPYYTFENQAWFFPLRPDISADSLKHYFAASADLDTLLQHCAAGDQLTFIGQELKRNYQKPGLYYYTCYRIDGTRKHVDSVLTPFTSIYTHDRFAGYILSDLMIVRGNRIKAKKIVADHNGTLIYDLQRYRRYSIGRKGNRKFRVSAAGFFYPDQIRGFLRGESYTSAAPKQTNAICSRRQYNVRIKGAALKVQISACDGPGLPPALLFYFNAVMEPMEHNFLEQ